MSDVSEQASLPGAPSHDVINLECDADTEEQRQRYDVGKIERQTVEDADLERYRPGEQQGHQSVRARPSRAAVR